MAKKEGVRKLFDSIAPDYDKLNHILSLNIDKGWRKKLYVNLLTRQNHSRYLMWLVEQEISPLRLPKKHQAEVR